MPSWLPILNGDYDDFTSEWYKQVGVSIILTMLLGIFSPHLANGVYWLKDAIIRFWDRRWTCDRKRTKQIFQSDYEQMYMGPELLFEYRYSTLLNMVYISLMYGTGMPVLYFFGSVTFFLSYWIDKWTLLRIYQTPPRYNKDLMKTTREWMNIAVLLHFVFGFWMYSNSVIFETSEDEIFGVNIKSNTEEIDKEYPWLNIQERLSQYHSLLYLVFLVLFLIIFIVKVFFLRTIVK